MTVNVDIATAAYLAGLIDGEGYVGIRRRNPTSANRLKAPKFSACVSVEMTDEAPVRFLAAAMGMDHQVTSRERPRCKRIFQINAENERAATVLRAVLPYLIAKKRQAQLALELDDLRRTSRKHRTKVVGTAIWSAGTHKGKRFNIYGTSDEFVARCAALHEAALRGAARSGKGASFRRNK